MGDNNKINNEIDILGIIRKLLRDWKLITLFAFSFAVLGVVVALCRTKEYTTNVILAPEASGNDFSRSLGSFSDILGNFSAGASNDAISPELYPNIFTSTSFLLDLYDVPIDIDENDNVITYSEHLQQVYKPLLISYPLIWMSKAISYIKGEEEEATDVLNPFHLTKKQAKMCELMKSNIQCVVDQRTALITISVTDVDNVIAAKMADTVMVKLQSYITDYRTKKARQDLMFVEKLYKQSQDDYLKIQEEYARFSDANMNIARSTQKIKLDNLEKELELKMLLYSNMAQQLQVANQRVQERAPAFSVIQPATVSLESSSISNKVVVLLFAFLGAIVGAAWCLYFRSVIKVKE